MNNDGLKSQLDEQDQQLVDLQRIQKRWWFKEQIKQLQSDNKANEEWPK